MFPSCFSASRDPANFDSHARGCRRLARITRCSHLQAFQVRHCCARRKRIVVETFEPGYGIWTDGHAHHALFCTLVRTLSYAIALKVFGLTPIDQNRRLLKIFLPFPWVPHVHGSCAGTVQAPHPQPDPSGSVILFWG